MTPCGWHGSTRRPARAISVLTDARHFQGALAHLRDARSRGLPVLRKGLCVPPLPALRGAWPGADAVLLHRHRAERHGIARVVALACKPGHGGADRGAQRGRIGPRAAALDPAIIGVNNRNFADLRGRFRQHRPAARLILPAIAVVGESGIKSPDDVRATRAAAVDAVQGEALVRSKDIGGMTRPWWAGAAPAA